MLRPPEGGRGADSKPKGSYFFLPFFAGFFATFFFVAFFFAAIGAPSSGSPFDVEDTCGMDKLPARLRARIFRVKEPERSSRPSVDAPGAAAPPPPRRRGPSPGRDLHIA
jgi:hypothetical protein